MDELHNYIRKIVTRGRVSAAENEDGESLSRSASNISDEGEAATVETEAGEVAATTADDAPVHVTAEEAAAFEFVSATVDDAAVHLAAVEATGFEFASATVDGGAVHLAAVEAAASEVAAATVDDAAVHLAAVEAAAVEVASATFEIAAHRTATIQVAAVKAAAELLKTAAVKTTTAGTSKSSIADDEPFRKTWLWEPVSDAQFHVSFACSCEACEKYRSQSYEGVEERMFDPKGNPPKDYPPISPDPNNPRHDRCVVDMDLMGKVFDSGSSANLGEEEKYNLISSYTYMPMDLTSFSEAVYSLTLLSDYLQFDDLEKVLDGDIALTTNFLRKALALFVESWRGYFAQRAHSEWSAWKTRKFVAFLLQFPTIADKLQEAVGYWPRSNTPLTIFESLCDKHLFCVDTLILLINVTRISGMIQYLEDNSTFMRIFKHRFNEYCIWIRKGTKLNDLLMKFLVNLGRSDKFARFAVKSSSGYMITKIIPEMITTANKNLNAGTGLEIWPYLRDLCRHDAAREFIMANPNFYIGQILYPIAGPENLTADVLKNLPDALKNLPPNKKRVTNWRVDECILEILTSLCHYKNSSETLRAMNVHIIIKNYRKAEWDQLLLKKIDDLLNLLIPKNESEMSFDDLMFQLAFNKGGSGGVK